MILRAALVGLAAAVVAPPLALVLVAAWPLVLCAVGLFGPFVLMDVLPAIVRAEARRSP